MSKSSIIIGGLLGVGLFVILLCPWPYHQIERSTDAIGLKGLIESLVQAASSNDGVYVARNPPKDSPPVVTVDSKATSEAGTGDFVTGKTDLGPSVNFEWQDISHVLTTADVLGLRVVAVGRRGIAGQVVQRGSSVALISFSASLSDFSQIVRVLPADFFGRELALAAGQPVAEYMVLVPPDVEQSVAGAVRSALKNEGMCTSSVSGVRAQLTAVNGRPSVRITQVFERS